MMCLLSPPWLYRVKYSVILGVRGWQVRGWLGWRRAALILNLTTCGLAPPLLAIWHTVGMGPCPGFPYPLLLPSE